MSKLGSAVTPKLESMILSFCLSPTLAPLHSWLSNLSSLTINQSPGPTLASLFDALSKTEKLSHLSLTNMGQITRDIWAALPWKTLKSLDFTGDACLEAPEQRIAGAEGLESLTVESCGRFEVTAVFLSSFPTLQRLYCDDLPPAVAGLLPSHSLRVLQVSQGKLTGEELPASMPELSDVWLGTKMNDKGLIRLSLAAPKVARLNIRLCEVSNEGAQIALEKWPLLTHLDVRGCGVLADPFVIEAIKKSGAKLRAWKSSGSYALTSAQVVQVLDVENFRVLDFFSPRDPLLLALRPGLVNLTLGACQTISPEGWAAIIAASVNLKVLSLTQIGNVTEERLAGILESARAIEEIVLNTCPQLLGSGLSSASQNRRLISLKSLTLQHCCVSETDFCKTLSGTPNLETLILEASGESNDAIRTAALHCKSLRRISVSSPAKRYSLTDPEGWLARVGSLREFESIHMEKFALDFVKSAPCLGQLHTLQLFNLFKLSDDVVEAITKYRSLQIFVTERVGVRMNHLRQITSSKVPLVMLRVNLDENSEEGVVLAESLPFLRYLSFRGAHSANSAVLLPKEISTKYLPVEKSFLLMERARTKWVEPGLIELLKPDGSVMQIHQLKNQVDKNKIRGTVVMVGTLHCKIF